MLTGPEPRFLASATGPVFVLHSTTQGEMRSGVLVLPPVAEELNKSRRDLVATEFELLLERSADWQAAFRSPRVVIRKLAEATHTFQRREWRDWVASATAEFIG